MTHRPAVPDPEALNSSELRNFPGHPGQFWPAFLAFACHQASARAAILLSSRPTDWKTLYRWVPDSRQQVPELPPDTLSRLAESSLQQGCAWTQLEGLAAMALPLAEHERNLPTVVVLLLEPASAADLEGIARRLQLITDIPATYQRERKARQAQQDLATFAEVLDLQLLMHAQPRFLSAAMTLVNEAVARYRCSRVSLGWAEYGSLRLQAVSHMERFERKMDIIVCLEAAMEEAFDQDAEIFLPSRDASGAIVRAHEDYARHQQLGYLLSLPLRCQDRALGVLTCERLDAPFPDDEVRALRILCDQISGRLHDLKQHERWFGARARDWLQEQCAGRLGAEHTLVKLAGLSVFVLLFLAAVIKLPYRVEAPFLLRSEDVRQVSVPFDGFINEIHVKIGQHVEANELLLNLDPVDLMLEEAAAQANHARFQREVEKARAFGTPNEMMIAKAQADQARAQLELVRQHLGQVGLRAPITGVVVEGDLEQLRGSPVDKGDVLFKIARHENLYVELKVDERDIHELAVGQSGRFAFVSQPRLKYPLRIDQIDPIARVEPDGNVFLVRARELPQVEDWWRPGMSGIAKIDIGSRRVLWIFAHRTIDFFQLRMWW